MSDICAYRNTVLAENMYVTRFEYLIQISLAFICAYSLITETYSGLGYYVM